MTDKPVVHFSLDGYHTRVCGSTDPRSDHCTTFIHIRNFLHSTEYEPCEACLNSHLFQDALYVYDIGEVHSPVIHPPDNAKAVEAGVTELVARHTRSPAWWDEAWAFIDLAIDNQLEAEIQAFTCFTARRMQRGALYPAAAAKLLRWRVAHGFSDSGVRGRWVSEDKWAAHLAAVAELEARK